MFGRRKKTRTYHYLMTVTMGPKWGSYGGTIEWSGTRNEAFLHIYAESCKKAGTDRDKTFVLCWVFEPDELS